MHQSQNQAVAVAVREGPGGELEVLVGVFEAPPELDAKELDEARRILAAGRHIATRKAPYFRSLLYKFVTREHLSPTPEFYTLGAAQNMIALWCPHFILGKLPASWFPPGKAPQAVTPEQMAGLWLHEVGHVLNKHGKRRGAREPKRWNHAGDLSINPAVKEMGAELPEGGLWPADFGFPEHETADVYYSLLEKRDQGGAGGGSQGAGQGQQPGQGAPGQGGGQPGQQPGGGRGRGRGKGQPSQDPGQGDGEGDGDGAPHPGRGWCGSCAGRPIPGEPEADDPEGRGEGELDRAVKDALQAVKDAAQRGKGNVPLGLVRLADEQLRPPKVPWRQKLGAAVRSAASWAAGAVNHRYDAPSRRQAGVGYGPGRPVLARLRRPVPRVAVAVDTSGSMGKDELTRAVSETEGILKALGAQVDLCVCDAEVHGLTKVRTTAEVLKGLKGGGGTFFQPVFDALDKLSPRPEVVVFLTDGGCFDKPRQPAGMRVIWVLVGAHREVPVTWGDIIEVDEEDAAPESG